MYLFYSLKPRHPITLQLKITRKRKGEREPPDLNYLFLQRAILNQSRQPHGSNRHCRMDQQEMIDSKGWTEERHAAFLNWMEESFVHRMLGPICSKEAIGFWPSQKCSPAPCNDLPLNRVIPDSATESTGDSRPRPKRLLAKSGNKGLVVVSNTNRNRMSKRLLAQPHDQLGAITEISKKKRR